jgi:hypothetical protein
VLKLGITEADLQHMFEQFWSVTEIKVITDRETGQPRGSAFVTMSVVKELIARAIHKRSLSNAAKKHLEKLGVEVRLNHAVDKIDGEGVIVNGERVASRTVIWTAGVAPSPAGKWLGVQTDRAGRVRVQNDLPVPDHPEIFVIDDTASLDQDGKPLTWRCPGSDATGTLRRFAGKLSAKMGSSLFVTSIKVTWRLLARAMQFCKAARCDCTALSHGLLGLLSILLFWLNSVFGSACSCNGLGCS